MAANAEYINLRDIALPVVGLANTGAVANRQTTQFLTVHGLTSTNDFGRLEPHQAKDLVKTMNSRHPDSSLGILAQNNLTGLIWHVKDQRRRGLVVDPNDVDEDVLLNGHLAYEAYVQNRDKGENIKSLEKWTDKVDFDDWDRKVTETLSLIYGRNYCPLAYVIRPDKPIGWDPLIDATTDYECLMYQLALNGPAFDRDNEAVFSYIQLAVLQTLAENWIFDAVPGRDGRAAMRALRNHYQGEAELDVRATKAQNILDTLTYTSEKNMPFETMITTLNKAYNSLKRQGQEFTDRSKVEQLAKRIKNPSRDIQVTVAVETMATMHRNDYNAASQYITSRMASINVANVNTPGNPRRIAEAEVERVEYNGVDIRDPWRPYSDDEWWRQLGRKGREIVEAKRKRNAGRGGGRGNGGRFGRGRGGRFGRSGRGGRGGRGGRSNPQGTDTPNNNRNVSEANSNERTSEITVGNGNGNSSTQSVSTVSLSQASTNNERGGQNGNRFGSSR
jgi:hypothetical protein